MSEATLPRIKTRTKRRRRRPFGPTERWALALLLICIIWAPFCVWAGLTRIKQGHHFWATYDLSWAVFYVWYIRRPWAILKAWLDSEE